MKIFQIYKGFCHWDVTKIHPTIEDTVGKYASDIVFVEAPDYVFEGWGYDETKEGDERFIKPTPPEGWAYDDETGTFYDPNYIPEPTPEEQLEEMVVDQEYRITMLELGLAQSDSPTA